MSFNLWIIAVLVFLPTPYALYVRDNTKTSKQKKLGVVAHPVMPAVPAIGEQRLADLRSHIPGLHSCSKPAQTIWDTI